MWAQYKKTFVYVQLVIALVVVAVYGSSNRQLPVAAVYFVIMQVGAVLGASWAARLKQTFLSTKK